MEWSRKKIGKYLSAAVPHIVFVNYKCRSPLNSARLYLHQFILPNRPIFYILSDIIMSPAFTLCPFHTNTNIFQFIYIYICVYKQKTLSHTFTHISIYIIVMALLREINAKFSYKHSLV